MKKVLWAMMAVVLVCVTIGQAEIMYLNHFDNTTSVTPSERLAADYGQGGKAVASIASNGNRPDVMTTNMKFGAGSAQMANNTGQALALHYKALGNVDPMKGSFESWLYTEGYQNRHFSIFNVTDANNRILIVNDGDSATRGKIEYRIQTAGGVEKTYISSNVMPKYQWVHFAADWKLDSATASENFIRLWMNGVKTIDVSGFAASTMALTEIHNMGIFSRNSAATADTAWLGYGDEVRITDELISSLYTIDGSGNFTPPTEAFVVPEPITMGLLAIGGVALIRRKR